MKFINQLTPAALIVGWSNNYGVSSFTIPSFGGISSRSVSQRVLASNRASFGLSLSMSGKDDNDDNDSFASTVSNVASQIKGLKDSIIVVKYGGNAMTSPELAQLFCQDVATLQKLGAKIIVVHGGGPQISSMLETVNVESKFSESGMRISTPQVVEIAEMVLCGSVNKQIANGICNAGGSAIGLSGRDNKLMQCVQKGSRDEIGFVGNVDAVNVDFLNALLDLQVTPVISPIGCGKEANDEQDVVYNVNADVAAGRLAGMVGAKQVVFLTDIAGVLNKDMELLQDLTLKQVDDLIEDETITGGMIPKVQYAMDAVKQGVESAKIIDGRVQHALLNQILVQAADGGTTIRD